MLTIRAATIHDAEAIAHVHVQSWRTTYFGIVPEPYLASLNEADRVLTWRDWLTRDIQVFVANLNGELVGFISGGALREPLPDYDAELFTLYLLQHAQGRAIGTALLKALAKSLHDKNFKSLAVWVLEKNPAVRFYEKSAAHLLSSKEIEIGGIQLTEIAYGWPHLKPLISSESASDPAS